MLLGQMCTLTEIQTTQLNFHPAKTKTRLPLNQESSNVQMRSSTCREKSVSSKSSWISLKCRKIRLLPLLSPSTKHTKKRPNSLTLPQTLKFQNLVLAPMTQHSNKPKSLFPHPSNNTKSHLTKCWLRSPKPKWCMCPQFLRVHPKKYRSSRSLQISQAIWA